ncbi:hypothetical protein ACQPZ2_12230 [Nocardia pseudovaccinii]|uniref:hypothetical protein n=1 Tax=Nocardia pseudovaccinii TaxID=189540 RepID=UPI003D914B1B
MGTFGLDHRQLAGDAVGGIAALAEGGGDALVVQPGAGVVPALAVEIGDRAFEEVEQVALAAAEGGADVGEGGGPEGPVPFVGRRGAAGVVAVEDEIAGASDAGPHRDVVGFDEETADIGAGAGRGVVSGLYLEPGGREAGERESSGEGDLHPDIGQIALPADLAGVQKNQAPHDQRPDARQPQRRRMAN